MTGVSTAPEHTPLLSEPAGHISGRFYLPQLDGLRFCAFLAVFLHHAPLFPGGSRVAAFAKQMGWAGVDLFFVLSSYLLMALLHREHAATGETDLRSFFIRRALRIWPLFFVYVALCFAYFLATDGAHMAAVAGRTVGHLFFVDNVFTAISDEYNPLANTAHLWTIAFEEQTYVLIPLVFMAIAAMRRNRRLLWMVALAAAVSQPVLRLALETFYTRERAVWVLPFVHFDATLAGLLLGAGVGATVKARVPGDACVAVAGAIVAGMLLAPHATDFSMWLPDGNPLAFTVLALAFSLVVLGCLDGGSWTARLLALPPLVFLGRISYGLYVWHWLGLQLSAAWLAGSGDWQTWSAVVVTALLLTIALSVLSFFLLERPFLRMKRRFTVVPNRID